MQSLEDRIVARLAFDQRNALYRVAQSPSGRLAVSQNGDNSIIMLSLVRRKLFHGPSVDGELEVYEITSLGKRVTRRLPGAGTVYVKYVPTSEPNASGKWMAVHPVDVRSLFQSRRTHEHYRLIQPYLPEGMEPVEVTRFIPAELRS